MEPAQFQLHRVIIPAFSYKEAEERFYIINVHLNPSGVYNNTSGEFKLTTSFRCLASTEGTPIDTAEVISGVIEGYYTIENKPKKEEIPELFYSNAIGIIYPYLRAFISNVTLQTGARFIVLPILNLISLGD